MLANRSLVEEQMDALDLDPATYARILSDLARVNNITLARRPTLNFLRQASQRQKRLRILDVGFGDGDMLRSIARWGKRSGVALDLVGIDLNPKSAAVAEATTPESLRIDWRTGDYAALIGEGFDLILSSLVAHHMTHEQLIAFLRFMDKEARLGWFVNDLHRHGFAWLGYPLLARLMLCHRIVREDGQLSIARSYRPSEWPPLLAEAGVSGARVSRVFPFRLCVSSLR
jgi:2-polyprenyl-3-methyl-5-hydroxy-6-metoxy-1,4-benzoquinol methylase